MFPIVIVNPFLKWGINYTTWHIASKLGHKYIIMVVDYFTKWEEAMSTYSNDVIIVALFLLNHVIARFGVPKQIILTHASHLQNSMMSELSTCLWFVIGGFYSIGPSSLEFPNT
jgi:hypothetical protein